MGLKRESAELIILCAFSFSSLVTYAQFLRLGRGGGLLSLTLADLADVIAYQLLWVGLCSAHDEVAGRPKIAGWIFLFHARELAENLLRSLLAHDAHQVAGRGVRLNVCHPLQIFRAHSQEFQ